MKKRLVAVICVIILVLGQEASACHRYTIHGIGLGMTQGDVWRVVGLPNSQLHFGRCDWYVLKQRYFVAVIYNDRDVVEYVTGDQVEVDGQHLVVAGGLLQAFGIFTKLSGDRVAHGLYYPTAQLLVQAARPEKQISTAFTLTHDPEQY